MILSLFSSCGALDLGFEAAGFETGLAFDIRPQSIASWNRNRPENSCAHVADISQLTIPKIDAFYGSTFNPTGVVGGPPCQSFSQANHFRSDSDPRSKLVAVFFSIALKLHQRQALDFIAMENVRELENATEGTLLQEEVDRLQSSGFTVFKLRLNARDFGVPQNRRRLFIIAINNDKLGKNSFQSPPIVDEIKTVRDFLSGLPDPVYFSNSRALTEIPHHPNHWCMTPKSIRFFDGSLKSGSTSSRSFKTLAWDRPSITVSYGHREVHVHPNGKRRLSIFEAMKLQGFPDSFVLEGTLSSQVDQVSEAVPPPLAEAVAHAIKAALINTNGEAHPAGTPADSSNFAISLAG